MSELPPTPNGSSGRGPNGKFLPGNRLGKGNPFAQRTQRLRVALLESVSPADVEQIIDAMVAAAKKGDVVAAREVLDRTIGRSVATDILQRIEALEAKL